MWCGGLSLKVAFPGLYNMAFSSMHQAGRYNTSTNTCREHIWLVQHRQGANTLKGVIHAERGNNKIFQDDKGKY